MAKILVPDYQGQHVISGIRSLVRQGDICDVAWNKRYCYSKYVKNFYRISSSNKDDSKYVSDIIKLCHNKEYDAVLPFGNSSYYALSKHSQKLNGNVNVIVPDYELYSIAHDKYKTIEFCKNIGISTPELFTDYTYKDINDISRHVRYPVVIKAKIGTGVEKGLRYANNEEELKRYYYEISECVAETGASNYESPIIQEYIPGFIHDACTLTINGKVINILTQRRNIMYPIYGGVGAVNVTTHDQKLSSIARKLLEALKWHGPAQIEFKYDERDKQYKIIEINPKLWGTLDLSIKVGMDFPLMIRNILLGEDVETNKNYPEGVRYKFLFPQATFAYLQSISEFGFKGIFDSATYKMTYYDFDISDLSYELHRILGTLKSIFHKRVNAVNSNISKNLISRV